MNKWEGSTWDAFIIVNVVPEAISLIQWEWLFFVAVIQKVNCYMSHQWQPWRWKSNDSWKTWAFCLK
jgi:hypothetical protein